MNDREQRIREKAYELWEAAGKPQGQEGEHWAEAERQVSAEEFSQGNGESIDREGAGAEGAVEQVIADVPVVRKKRATSAGRKAAETGGKASENQA